MNPEELRKHTAEQIEADGKIKRVQEKIGAGTAGMADSQAYALRAGEITGKALAACVPEFTPEERSSALFGLLRDRYKAGNAVFDAIQTALDEAQGLHMRVRHAVFPEQRAKAMANALSKQDAEIETIQRRAESAANIVAAMHDANVRANVEFRDRAGLRSYATRDGGSHCCDFCAGVEGRYPANEVPDGFWGRHDHCGCSISYECGRRRGSDRARRNFEHPAPDAGTAAPVRFTAENAPQGASVPVRFTVETRPAGAPEPVTLTAAEAARIQAANGLTMPAQDDIIMERGAGQNSSGDLYSFGKAAGIGSDLFSEDALRNLHDTERKISRLRTEIAYLFGPDGAQLLKKEGEASKVTFTPEEQKMMPGCILTHNHPNLSSFSPDDIWFMIKHGLSEMRAVIQGGAYILQRTNRTVKRAPNLDDVTNAYYAAYEEAGNKLQLKAAQHSWRPPYYLRRVEEETIRILSRKYKLNFRMEVVGDE